MLSINFSWVNDHQNDPYEKVVFIKVKALHLIFKVPLVDINITFVAQDMTHLLQTTNAPATAVVPPLLSPLDHLNL